MRRRPKTFSWRWLVVAVCLFVLSLAAPRVWRALRTLELAPQPGLPIDAAHPPAGGGIHYHALAGGKPSRLDVPGMDRAGLGRSQPAPRVGARFDGTAEPDDGFADDPPALIGATPAPALPAKWLSDDSLPTSSGRPVDDTATYWAPPRALLHQLDQLATHGTCRSWALKARRIVESLTGKTAHDAGQAARWLDELRDCVAQADVLLSHVQHGDLASDVRRARHALRRRHNVWRAAAAIEAAPAIVYVKHSLGREDRLAERVDGAATWIRDSKYAPLWNEYLLLEELRRAAGRRAPSPAGQHLAHRVLWRFDHPQLTIRQRKFLAAKPLTELSDELRRMTDDSVDVTRLLDQLEEYEWTSKASLGRSVAADLGRLSRSTRTAEKRLYGELARHYRTPNVRLAVTEELFTRLLPPDQRRVEAVHDVITGVPVHGRSTTNTSITARLINAGKSMQVELQAQGVVRSSTTGRSSPVTTYNYTRSHFLVKKLVEIKPEGVVSHPPCVSVNSRTFLRGLRTDFDDVPLLGGLVRSYAENEYAEGGAQRRREIESRVAARALAQFEQNTAPALQRLNQRFFRQVLWPVHQLRLEPQGVMDQPTPERVALRFRVAARHQLGAHTPRPRALAGSLASLQVHESLINNFFQQLDLGGETLTLPELFGRAAAALRLPEGVVPKELPDELQFTFAEQDPIQVRFEDGRINLALSLDKLRARGKCWRNLEVFVRYRPRQSGPALELYRDGSVSLKGRLGLRSQLIVRGIFSALFDQNERYDILQERLTTDERLKNLRITQCTLTDGWLGLSLGEEQTSQTLEIAEPNRPARARR